MIPTTDSRSQMINELSALSMLSIIEWYAWNDKNGEFDDMTFDEAVEIAMGWFDGIDPMKEFSDLRYRFLLETEND